VRIEQGKNVIDIVDDPPAPPTAVDRLLFTPATVAGMTLFNRVVMAPMTRGFAPAGVVGDANVAYYRRRAVGGVGLIITEGSWIDHPAAGDDRDIPRLFGPRALPGWARVVDAVHESGTRILAQLWHQGLMRPQRVADSSGVASISPSGYSPDAASRPRAMTTRDIDDVIDAYARSAVNAKSVGFDGVELHGAHGYLIDEFLWPRTNLRTDRYGGSAENRTRLACEIVTEVKRRVGVGFPVSLRLSQWKQLDYAARIADSADEWNDLLQPLVRSGVDLFHLSTRRYAEPAFAGSELPLAGLTRKLAGRPVITVGSVGLNDAKQQVGWETDGQLAVATVAATDDIEARLARAEFDLVAVGRALLANPEWPDKVRAHRLHELAPYTLEARAVLR
jgi:2,4-dienoyl-CoA reductase-like NADH-dependent reductase (Old Yellow Enzyme family)